MNQLNLTTILQPAFQVFVAGVATLILRYLPRLLTVMEARLDLHVTDQDNAALLRDVQTAAGAIETLIDQRLMSVAHVTLTNDGVRTRAQAIVDAMPVVGDSLGLTVDKVAEMIIAAVDTGSRVSRPQTQAPTGDVPVSITSEPAPSLPSALPAGP